MARGLPTASNPEEEAALEEGFWQCHALGWNTGLPSGGPKSTRRGRRGVCPHVLLQPTTSCLLSSAPLPHATSALPTPPPASREVRKPRAVETSWVSRHLCRAPVPTWARHQCPVGEGKGGAPAKPETPSLNPVGPLCPSSRPPPGLVMPPPRLPPVLISGVRVRERRWRREAQGGRPGAREGTGRRGSSGVLQVGV